MPKLRRTTLSKVQLTQEDEVDVTIAALRYYMGRQTISVHSFCQLLIREWDNLTPATRAIIERDLNEERQRDTLKRQEYTLQVQDAEATQQPPPPPPATFPLGADMDRRAWEDVWHHIQKSKNQSP